MSLRPLPRRKTPNPSDNHLLPVDLTIMHHRTLTLSATSLLVACATREPIKPNPNVPRQPRIGLALEAQALARKP